MTQVLEEWIGYCCDREGKTQHNKVYALCRTDDGTVHRRFGGVGEKLHEQIERAPMQLAPAERVDWAHNQYRKVLREKMKRYKNTGIQFQFPTAFRYDAAIQFDVPFLSPLGDPPYTVPSFRHELEAPPTSTLILQPIPVTAASAVSAPAPPLPATAVQGRPPAGVTGTAQAGSSTGGTLYLRCSHCQYDNPEGEEFCAQCGMELRGNATVAQVTVASSRAAVPAAADLECGTLLKQRYHIVGQVGKGGFGAVYKAKDTQLGDRLVAVKEMDQGGVRPEELPQAIEAFKREALLLASLKDSHLPHTYDHFSEGGSWYLVMDFIEGQTLEEYLDQRQLLLEEALTFGIQLCLALGYLHSRQPPVIFRDLKPANVMRDGQGQLYLIDFGIARHFKAGQEKDTTALGSPGYAAPEQYGRTQTKPQSDIYSLGALLHHMLSGNDPSESPFFFAPLRQQNAAIPEGLAVLVRQMVEMDMTKRPNSVEAVRLELEHILAQLRA
jgi:tRNA A-37 threonylcarbamoyl transferase component Bud32